MDSDISTCNKSPLSFNLKIMVKAKKTPHSSAKSAYETHNAIGRQAGGGAEGSNAGCSGLSVSSGPA